MLLITYIAPRQPRMFAEHIECVKAVRAVSGLSLKDAKELCDEVRDNLVSREIAAVLCSEQDALRILNAHGMKAEKRTAYAFWSERVFRLLRKRRGVHETCRAGVALLVKRLGGNVTWN